MTKIPQAGMVREKKKRNKPRILRDRLERTL